LVLKGEDDFKDHVVSQHAFVPLLGQGHDANIMTCKISFLVALHFSHLRMGPLSFVTSVEALLPAKQLNEHR